MTRVLGKVKWFDRIRGFGVIGRTHGEPDCLVYHSGARGTMHNLLAAGEVVEFEVVQSGGGTTARDVVRRGIAVLATACEGV